MDGDDMAAERHSSNDSQGDTAMEVNSADAGSGGARRGWDLTLTKPTFQGGEGSDVEKHGAPLWSRSPHSAIHARRVEVLYDTLKALETPEKRKGKHEQAQDNLQRWSRLVGSTNDPPEGQTLVIVEEEDWGEVTHKLTKRFGKTFAALNMANAKHFGGAYTGGAAAQEENMFRRSDLHFHDELLRDGTCEVYSKNASDLINGEHGKVYLGENPSVCLRGKEISVPTVQKLKSSQELGYEWLSDDEIFPFFELRSAALDLRKRFQDQPTFSMQACRKKIDAQLDTLAERGIRHVVLGAFGCGAFQNPNELVAQCYCEALEARPAREFEVVAFAIYHAGYGVRNFGPFAKEMSMLRYPRFATEMIGEITSARHAKEKNKGSVSQGSRRGRQSSPRRKPKSVWKNVFSFLNK